MHKILVYIGWKNSHSKKNTKEVLAEERKFYWLNIELINIHVLYSKNMSIFNIQ